MSGAHAFPDPACEHLGASIPLVERVVNLWHCVGPLPLGFSFICNLFVLLQVLLLVSRQVFFLPGLDPVQVQRQHLQQILLAHIVDVFLRNGVHDAHAPLVLVVARVALHDFVEDLAQLHLVALELFILVLDELRAGLGLVEVLGVRVELQRLHIHKLGSALLTSRK